MRRLLLFFGLLSCLTLWSQRKPVNKNQNVITAEYAEMSNDGKVIATFIKANPDHPKTPALRSKLLCMIEMPRKEEAAKPVEKPLTPKKLETEVQRKVEAGANEKTVQAARVLNHLFDNNPNKKEAYVEITNRSKCNIVVQFKGKKFYNLNVNANTKNYILIDKGTYTLTTDVCDAKYSTTKNINADISLSLK